MDNEKILRDIGAELDIFQAHIKRLSQKSGKLHALDVDLLQDKTRKIYDTLFVLEESISGKQELKVHSEPPIEETHKPEVTFEDTVIEEEVETRAKLETVLDEPLIKEEVVILDEPTIEQETEPEVEEVIFKTEVEPEVIEKLEVNKVETPEIIIEETLPVVEEKISEEVIDEEIVIGRPSPVNEIREPLVERAPEIETNVRSTIDLFTDTVEETVADKFGSEDDSSIAGKMQQSQIEDLRQAIGINEKFLFINGLFNGDLGRYNRAIDEFNELSTKEGIDTHFLELKVHNQWSDINEGVVKLKALLDRKFN